RSDAKVATVAAARANPNRGMVAKSRRTPRVRPTVTDEHPIAAPPAHRAEPRAMNARAKAPRIATSRSPDAADRVNERQERRRPRRRLHTRLISVLVTV